MPDLEVVRQTREERNPAPSYRGGLSGAVGIRKGKQCANALADQLRVIDLLNLIPVAKGGTLYPLGPTRFRAPRAGFCDPSLSNLIAAFQTKNGLPVDGVVDPQGETLWRLVQLSGINAKDIPPPPKPPAPDHRPGRLYTEHPNEVRTQTTVATIPGVYEAVRANWPELTDAGGRTLTCQFVAETGEGKSCFNWNLGNMKSPRTDVPHMYLQFTWECYGEKQAEAAMRANPGLVRYAEPDEIRKRGWRCVNRVVVFTPPHPAARFRAFASLSEGAKRWVAHHQRIATTQAGYLEALNAGDIPEVARRLDRAKYASASEADYRKGMLGAKPKVDAKLGPPAP